MRVEQQYDIKIEKNIHARLIEALNDPKRVLFGVFRGTTEASCGHRTPQFMWPTAIIFSKSQRD